MYDITKHMTYEHVFRWLKEVKDFSNEEVVVMVVGNKTDLRHLRAVSTEEAKTMCGKLRKLITAACEDVLFSVCLCVFH